MKPRLSLKILYRSPVKTVLTFVLLVAVTFALFSQVLEYSVAKREMNKAVAEYNGVGSVVNGAFSGAENNIFAYMYADERVENFVVPEELMAQWRQLGYGELTEEQRNKISSLPYITYTDTRCLTAGVTEYRRLSEDIQYYEYTHNCVIEGTVKGVDGYKRLILSDVECIGGEPVSPKVTKFGEVDILVQEEPYVLAEMTAEKAGRETLFYFQGAPNRAVSFASDRTKYGDREMFDSFETGGRYVFVLRYDDYGVKADDTIIYYLTDVFSYGQCEAVYSLKGEPDNYLETEKFAPLREYIEIIETDMYTQDMVYTYDMDSIRYFADGTMGITEGRAITPEDTEQGNNVCVIHHDFAQEYGLEIGDIITVDLGNKLFEYNYQTGAVSAVKDRASTEYTSAKLEIVGIFKDGRNKYASLSGEEMAWSYGKNVKIIPQHLLNAEEKGHKVYPQEFGFVVENAWDLPAFKEEVFPQLEEMGLTVYFEDGGFEEIITVYRETERIALIKIAILLFAIIVITWFVTMLYVVGRRRDYAVMRLLGTSKAMAAKSLLLPLGVIAVAAVIIGSAAAYVYTARNIAGNASLAVLSDFETDISLPVWVILACVAGEIALTVTLAYALLAAIGRKSPLELMQANVQKGRKYRKRKKKTAYAPDPKEPVVLGQWQSIEPLVPDGKNRSVKFAVNYALRHIRRTAGKALMFIIVTVLLINVAGQLLVMKESYVKVFESTDVESRYAGFLNIGYVDELIDSGYVKNVYYRIVKTVDINRAEADVVFSNDPYAYALEMGYENFEIEFLEGYDEKAMYGLGKVVIMSENFMAERGINTGDTVEFSQAGWYSEVQATAIRNFGNTASADEYTAEEIIALTKEETEARYLKKMDGFTVIGSISGADNLVITPGCDAVNIYYGKMIIPPFVNAVLEDNYRAEEYREYGMGLAGKNLTGEIAFVMDTSKIDNVKNNIRLMEMLYPIMVAAALVISAFLCGMLIAQTSKDIAIMRVLGTPKRKVRGILVTEQMILCVIGILLAATVLSIRGVFSQMAAVFGLYAVVVFLASFISSSLASRKSPLMLLQTKE